jgi:hypothetical protein
MNEFLGKCKFEYIFAVLVLLVLTAALFTFSENEKIPLMIVTVLTNSITGITTYLFTKHVPGGNKNE